MARCRRTFASIRSNARHLPQIELTSMMRRGLVVLVLLLGCALRFHRLGAQSLWYDEGNSVRMTERSAAEIVAAVRNDIHPPGYFLVLAGWVRVAGRSEFALRALSALSGVLLLAGVQRIAGRRALPLAALLAALHPALVYYSQEARMYMPAAALGAALLLAGMHAWRARGWRTSAAYCLLAAAGLYTHYLFAVLIAAANVAALLAMLAAQRPWPKMRGWLERWVRLQFVALLLYLPWLPTAMQHLSSWPANRSQVVLLESLPAVWRWLAFGPTAGIDAGAQWAWALLAAAGLAGGSAVLAGAWLLVPAGLTLLFGLFTPAFAKFLALAAPAVAMLVADGAAVLWGCGGTRIAGRWRWPSRVLVAALLAAGLWATQVALQSLYFDARFARSDYRALAVELQARYQPGDAILLNAPNQSEVFTYYHPPMAHVIPVAFTRPLNAALQRAQLEGIGAWAKRVFVIYYGEAQADPQQVVERWLNSNAFKMSERWAGDVRVAEYAGAAVEGAVVDVNAIFADVIVLDTFALPAADLQAGDPLRLTLRWHAVAAVPQRYKVFVHVSSSRDAPPLAQHDSEPGGGLEPTSTWPAGVAIVDRQGVLLPAELPAGRYELLLGVYDPASGQRLPVKAAAALPGDRLLLATISIR